MERRYSLEKDWKAIAFLLALAGFYFLPVLSQGNRQVLSSIDGDTWSQFFYWRRFAYDSLARGDIPLWNPYNFSGQPFLAAMQSAIFYPLNLLFLIFDTPFAINLSIAIHCLCASLFTYLFARYMDLSSPAATLTAVTFAYSAPYFIHIYPGHLPHLAAMWMPLMFLAMEAFLRHKKMRYAIWAGVCLALEILAGYPQYPFYSMLAVSLYFLLHLILRKQRDRLLYFLGGYVAFIASAVMLAGVQLVPAWELVKNSARGAVTYQWVSIYSLPPENLLTLLLPNLFGDIVNVPYWGKNNLWEMSVYLGVVPLAMITLALILNRSRQVLAFAIMGGMFLLLALGKHTPFLWLLYTFIPGFDLFRGVGKAAFVFAFAGSMIAGFGFETLRQRIEKADRRLWVIGSLFAAAAVVIGIFVFLSAAADQYSWSLLVKSYVAAEEHFDPPPLDEQFFAASWKMFWGDVAKLLLTALSLAAACFMGRRAWSHAPRAIVLSILALAVVDLWHFGSRFLVSFDPQILAMDQELKAFFKTETERFRIATPLAHLRNHLLNIGMIEGIENVGGYDAIVVKSYNEFINLTQGLPIHEPNLLMGINRISPLLNLLNVKYYLVDPSVHIDPPDFDLAFQNGRHKVYRSRRALPRSFIVHDARFVADTRDAFRRMIGPGFDPTSTAIVEEEPGGALSDGKTQSPLPNIIDYSPKRVVIEAQPNGSGLLVLADSYFPGWKAFVDGSAARIHRVNHVMRGVYLTAGRHRVEFLYEPGSFKVGAWVSCVGMVVAAILLVGGRRRT